MCRLSAQKLRAISSASFLWWLRHQLYSTSARFDFCSAWSCSGLSSCFALDPTFSYTFRKFCWCVVLRQVYQAISFLLKYLFHRHQFRCCMELESIVTLTFWREWWWSLRSSRLCVGSCIACCIIFEISDDGSALFLGFWSLKASTCFFVRVCVKDITLKLCIRAAPVTRFVKERRQDRNSYICSRSGSEVS